MSTSVLLRLRLLRNDLSDWIRRPLVSAERYSSMAVGPLEDLILVTGSLYVVGAAREALGLPE